MKQVDHSQWYTDNVLGFHGSLEAQSTNTSIPDSTGKQFLVCYPILLTCLGSDIACICDSVPDVYS